MKSFMKLLAILLIATFMKYQHNLENTTHATARNTIPTETHIALNLPANSDAPGYSVALQSYNFHLNVACVFEPNQTTGKVVELNSDAYEIGTCDRQSLTLNTGIENPLTVRAMLDGEMVIASATRTPRQIRQVSQTSDCPDTCRQILFSFTD